MYLRNGNKFSARAGFVSGLLTFRWAARTFGWAAFSQFGRHALHFGSIIVLARLLSPDDFGVMSLAVVVTGFITLFRDMGTGAAVIQRQAADPSLVGTIYSFNALLSATAGLLTAAAAPFAAAFFRAPSLEPVLLVLAGSLALAGFGVVPQAVMERDGRFGRLAQIELGSVACGVLTGVAMAYSGFGLWSLVGQTVVTTSLTTLLLVVLSGARPALRPDWAQLRGVAKYSLNLSGFNLFNYLVVNADNAIIGKVLGARELGYYALAYHIALGPLRSIGAVVGRVLFPSLARLQHDRRALGREYLKAVRLMGLIGFPLTAMLVALADVATRALLGDSWQPMIPILVVLGAAAFMKSVSIISGNICVATGRTDILMRLGLATGVLAIAAFWIGAHLGGAVGVAIAFAAVTFAITYPSFYFILRIIGLPLSAVWRISAYPAAGGILTGLIAWLIAGAAEPHAGPLGALLAAGSGGALFFFLWYVATAHSASALTEPALGGLRARR